MIQVHRQYCAGRIALIACMLTVPLCAATQAAAATDSTNIGGARRSARARTAVDRPSRIARTWRPIRQSWRQLRALIDPVSLANQPYFPLHVGTTWVFRGSADGIAGTSQLTQTVVRHEPRRLGRFRRGLEVVIKASLSEAQPGEAHAVGASQTQAEDSSTYMTYLVTAEGVHHLEKAQTGPQETIFEAADPRRSQMLPVVLPLQPIPHDEFQTALTVTNLLNGHKMDSDHLRERTQVLQLQRQVMIAEDTYRKVAVVETEQALSGQSSLQGVPGSGGHERARYAKGVGLLDATYVSTSGVTSRTVLESFTPGLRR